MWPSQGFTAATYSLSLGLLTDTRSVKASLFVGGVLVVEAEPFHITNQPSDIAPVEVPTASRGEPARAPVRGGERWRNTPARLGLQRRAQFNFQRHVLRGFRR